VTEEPRKQSAAATAAEKVRAIVDAAERSAAELEQAAREDAARIRADAEREAEARVGDAPLIASRLAERADELERQVAAVRASVAALEAELKELRGAAPPAEPGPPPAAAEGEPVARVAISDEPDDVDARIAEAEAAAARGPDVPAAESAAAGPEGARVIALNMALNGTPRDETARYLAENFELEDADALLDDVYARAGS
jgi:hypothetical protein